MIRTTIEANAVFDREALADALGITANTISREILLGRLRAYRRSRHTYFLGQDILDWIRTGNVSPDQGGDDDAA